MQNSKLPLDGAMQRQNSLFPGDHCMHMVQRDGDANRMVLNKIDDVRLVQNDWCLPQIGPYRVKRQSILLSPT